MAVYQVSVRQRTKVATLQIVARSEREARILAEQQGVVLSQPTKRREGTGRGMRSVERYMFLYQLSTLVLSNVQLSDALRKMRHVTGGRVGQAAAELEAGLARGGQLPDLIMKDRRNFPGAVGLLVKAASHSEGGTPAALKAAADFENEVLNAVMKGSWSTWKAGAWVTLAAIGLFAMPLYLTPAFHNSTMFQMTKAHLEWDWLDQWSYIIGALLGVLMLMGLALFVVVGIGQRLFPETSDSIVLRIPFLREMVFMRDNYITMLQLSLLTRHGANMESSLEVTSSDVRPGALKEDLMEALSRVRKGLPWAAMLRTVSEINRMALSMGTDRERLAAILEQVADENKKIYIRRLEWLNPIMNLIAVSSMMALYVILSLYSFVPFGQLFGKMLSEASTI